MTSRDRGQVVDHLLAPVARLNALSSYGEIATAVSDLADCAHAMTRGVEREAARQGAIMLLGDLVEDAPRLVNAGWSDSQRCMRELARRRATA